MFKKKILLIIYFSITIFFNTNLYANINIEVRVNEAIITNIDIKKEAEYLKFLNPSLNQLNKDKVLGLAKTSLINEIIKKNEIIKLIDINQENIFVDDYLKNLYSKLNYNSEKEFKNELNSKNIYSIDEIRNKIKLELLWNELIYQKFNRQIKIDKEKLKNKINNIKNQNQKEYLLSEIVFTKKKDESLEDLVNQIKLSIKDIGFNNTANIYSISESSKFGGKLGLGKKLVFQILYPINYLFLKRRKYRYIKLK